MRTCLPLVRYTLNTGEPLADMPRLKNRACTENRGVSGNSRMANGSSKDSSISCRVKELSKLKGGLCQSNSIFESECLFVAHAMYLRCIYTVGAMLSTGKIEKVGESAGPPEKQESQGAPISGGWAKRSSITLSEESGRVSGNCSRRSEPSRRKGIGISRVMLYYQTLVGPFWPPPLFIQGLDCATPDNPKRTPARESSQVSFLDLEVYYRLANFRSISETFPLQCPKACLSNTFPTR